MSSQSTLIRNMISAAETAARSLLRDFNEVEKLQVSQKSPGQFVSKADTRAEEILFDQLVYPYPDYGFLMEESGAQNAGKSEYTFIIDPLDGTTNFLYGLPHWCISIALQKNDETVAAVVYDPLRQDMFTAEKGQGAFMNRYRLQVSGRQDKKMFFIAAGVVPGTKNAEHTRTLIADLYKHYQSTRIMGSAVLNLCSVARGTFDAYFSSGLKPWDMAAGELIVREAKGLVTDMSGGDQHLINGDILAGSGAAYKDVLKYLKTSAS